MPKDNQEAGLPVPEKMVSNVVKKSLSLTA